MKLHDAMEYCSQQAQTWANLVNEATNVTSMMYAKGRYRSYKEALDCLTELWRDENDV